MPALLRGNLCGPSLLSETPPAEDCMFHVGLLASEGPAQHTWKAHMLFLLTLASGCSLIPWDLAVLIVLA